MYTCAYLTLYMCVYTYIYIYVCVSIRNCDKVSPSRDTFIHGILAAPCLVDTDMVCYTYIYIYICLLPPHAPSASSSVSDTNGGGNTPASSTHARNTACKLVQTDT